MIRINQPRWPAAQPASLSLQVSGPLQLMDLFHILGRYFWLLCLALGGFQYLRGSRSLSSRDLADPKATAEAIALLRWFAAFMELPWLVMGVGIVIGGVPDIWHYFRPQDRNPFVLGWFITVFLLSFYFAYWVFFRGGAQKLVRLQPFELKWYRASWRGTTQGTIALTEGRVKLFAAIGPFWIAGWTYLISLDNVALPK